MEDSIVPEFAQVESKDPPVFTDSTEEWEQVDLINNQTHITPIIRNKHGDVLYPLPYHIAADDRTLIIHDPIMVNRHGKILPVPQELLSVIMKTRAVKLKASGINYVFDSELRAITPASVDDEDTASSDEAPREFKKKEQTKKPRKKRSKEADSESEEEDTSKGKKKKRTRQPKEKKIRYPMTLEMWRRDVDKHNKDVEAMVKEKWPNFPGVPFYYIDAEAEGIIQNKNHRKGATGGHYLIFYQKLQARAEMTKRGLWKAKPILKIGSLNKPIDMPTTALKNIITYHFGPILHISKMSELKEHPETLKYATIKGYSKLVVFEKGDRTTNTTMETFIPNRLRCPDIMTLSEYNRYMASQKYEDGDNNNHVQDDDEGEDELTNQLEDSKPQRRRRLVKNADKKKKRSKERNEEQEQPQENGKEEEDNELNRNEDDSVENRQTEEGEEMEAFDSENEGADDEVAQANYNTDAITSKASDSDTVPKQLNIRNQDEDEEDQEQQPTPTTTADDSENDTLESVGANMTEVEAIQRYQKSVEEMRTILPKGGDVLFMTVNKVLIDHIQKEQEIIKQSNK